MNLSEPGKPPVDPLDYFGNRGHGTAVAGVAASRGEGGAKRVRGAAPAALVAPMRAVNVVLISPNNSAFVARAVEQAIVRGAHVVSLSLGGFTAPAALTQNVTGSGNEQTAPRLPASSVGRRWTPGRQRAGRSLAARV